MFRSKNNIILGIIVFLLLISMQLANAANLDDGEPGGVYLNIDSINPNQKEVQFNLNAIETDLNKKEKINLDLDYKKGTNYDVDNNGIEEIQGVIDLTVENTKLDKELKEENLCTRWEIYSGENREATVVCYGSEKCCNFISLIPTKENWKEPLFISYGLYEVSYNNIVNSQVIHVDYNIGSENPYSKIYYSKWGSISAVFKDNNTNIEYKEELNKIQEYIEFIKNKDKKIKNVELKDSNGQEIKEIKENKKANLVFEIEEKETDVLPSDKEVVVEINNFDTANKEWEKSKNIDIKTENKELNNSLAKKGIEAKKIVSVNKVSEFLNEGEYFGTVKFEVKEEFNKVLYCPDDTINSCRIVNHCIDEFNGVECYKLEGNSLTIFVPHFSSIIVALEDSELNISIESPENSTDLISGENIYLNFSTNISVNAFYSLDNKDYINLNYGTEFSTILEGSLDYNVLANGQHNITIYVEESLGKNATADYSFSVNDIDTPILSVNITNNSIMSGNNLIISIEILSDEYANISYKINQEGFSGWEDPGNDKKFILNLKPNDGQNNLTVNAIDLHQNSLSYYINFNYTEEGNCSDALQNGDETGIDCGGRCSTCIAFNVSIQQQSYNLTDDVYVTVISRASSLVNLTVKKDGDSSYNHVFTPVFTGAPISEIRLIENTDDAGTYTIYADMHYMNITESKSLSFEVLAPEQSPLSLSINANTTTISEGESIRFTAAVSGNESSVSYKWDFENDGTIDSTLAEVNKTYGANGTYIVNLTIFSGEWNQSDVETINVRKLYNITFVVKDNSSQNLIQDAFVELDDDLRNTSSSGEIMFTKHEGENYDAIVTKQGYRTSSYDIDLEYNHIAYVNLTKLDEISPEIQLISPSNEETISSNQVKFVFKAIDNSYMTCKLYLSESTSSFWEIKNSNTSTINNVESNFIAKDLKNETYEWKISCIDREGNSNSSLTYTFKVNTKPVNELGVDLDEQDKDTEDIVSEINSALQNLENLRGKEKEVAEHMQIKKSLEKAIINIQRANRDLHSLKWRRLNDTELNIETQKILDKIEKLKKTVPKNLEVLDSIEFVKYPSKEDVKDATLILLNQTNLKLSKKELERIVKENHELQSLMTVTTESSVVSLEYISGETEIVTLIRKTISLKENLSDLRFYETIDKEIAEDVDEIVAFFDYEVIQKDPVIEINLEGLQELVYYIKKRISLENTQKARSILLKKDLKPVKKSFITGFSIFDTIGSKIIETSDLRLVIEIIVIIVLAGLYLVYSFGGIDKMKEVFYREVKEIHEIIDSALEDLSNNNYETASKKYKEVNSKFGQLETKRKDIIRPYVIDLANKINMHYINNLVLDANRIILDDRKKAFEIYSKIRLLYKIIPKEFKNEVSKKCLNLHNNLIAK